MNKFVKYGDRTMPVEADLTLEAIKELMARHFPELADPSIETKKTDDKTTYVFSKKAGHKGNATMRALIAAINQHCIAEMIAPANVLRAAETGELDEDTNLMALRAAMSTLRDEANAVRAVANALIAAPAHGTPTGSVL